MFLPQFKEILVRHRVRFAGVIQAKRMFPDPPWNQELMPITAVKPGIHKPRIQEPDHSDRQPAGKTTTIADISKLASHPIPNFQVIPVSNSFKLPLQCAFRPNTNNSWKQPGQPPLVFCIHRESDRRIAGKFIPQHPLTGVTAREESGLNRTAVNINDDTATVSASADMDGLYSTRFLATVMPLVQKHHCVVLDLSNIKAVTSAGLKALLEASQARMPDGRIVIITDNESILGLLKITGLTRLIEVYPKLNAVT